MATVNSFPDLTRDWEGLLASSLEHAEILVNIEPLRAPVEQALADAKTLKDRQESLKAQSQRATQELKELKNRGREAARRLRAAIRAQLGTDNELLTQFKIAPRRKRAARKPAVVKDPPQTTPTTPDPAPSTPTQQETVGKEGAKS